MQAYFKHGSLFRGIQLKKNWKFLKQAYVQQKPSSCGNGKVFQQRITHLHSKINEKLTIPSFITHHKKILQSIVLLTKVSINFETSRKFKTVTDNKNSRQQTNNLHTSSSTANTKLFLSLPFSQPLLYFPENYFAYTLFSTVTFIRFRSAGGLHFSFFFSSQLGRRRSSSLSSSLRKASL